MPDEHICPTCGGSGEGVTYDAGGAPAGWDCPDCGGSGKAENSITANEAQPLRLTLEEGVRQLGTDEAVLISYSGWEGIQYSVVSESSCEPLTPDKYSEWENALAYVLHRPVVARDDTAELVEALEAVTDRAGKLTADFVERLLDDNVDPDDWPESLKGAGAAVHIAEAALARVKGEQP